MVENFSKENFKSLDLEDADVPNLPDFAGREDFDIAPAAIVVISERYDIMEAQDGAVGFPDSKVNRVAAVKHLASRGYVNGTGH